MSISLLTQYDNPASSQAQAGNSTQAQTGNTTQQSEIGVEGAIATQFSVRAGDTTYSASIEHVGDVYTASVPNLPGVTASGSSVAQVEASLGALISFFA